MPHVWINSHQTGDNRASVLMGNEMAGRMAARYLLEQNCRNCVYVELPSLNPGVAARCDGFRFEFFSRQLNCEKIELPGKPVEERSLDDLARNFESAVNQGLFDGRDGIFTPESWLMPGLHVALRRFRPQVVWPTMICCNDSPELLAGLWPRPAVISLGEELLAEYACRELFRRIAGPPENDNRATTFVSPQVVPPPETKIAKMQ